MSVAKQMNSIQKRVEYLLRTQPRLRDSDNKLIATIWHNQVGNRSKCMSAFELLSMFAENQLHNPESIRRVRQKLQEKNEELRGEVWLQRQLETEKVKQFLREEL